MSLERSSPDTAGPSTVMAVNRGSSSLKFALYECGANDSLDAIVSGKIDRIGQPDASLDVRDLIHPTAHSGPTPISGHGDVADTIMQWLGDRTDIRQPRAVGHRVVHGGPRYWQPQIVTPELLEELRTLSPFDPEHLPTEIALIESFANRYPNMQQVACFDTAFHHDMPRVARILPIPREFERKGVQRYGFHGLSYAYLMEELERLAGREAAHGRIILAHLGSGASLAAVRDGKAIDTSMAFTPTAGIPMATRSGDLDPGLVWFLARTENMTPEQFNEMINRRSGLLGVSETSSDMRDLVARSKDDERAAEAIDLFCYQIKKWIGGYAAVLGGLDTLVFAGGIGENAPEIRSAICSGMEFLGLEIDSRANAAGESLVSMSQSRVAVRVIRTDEELMIARAVRRIVDAA